jgi:hypothetical protein
VTGHDEPAEHMTRLEMCTKFCNHLQTDALFEDLERERDANTTHCYRTLWSCG